MRVKGLLLSFIAAITFSACGGGSSSDPITKLFTVVDPYIKGATFYWDKNDNGQHDSDEPLSSASDENGQFKFNLNIPVGSKIVMKDQGEHNGVAYTGNLSAIISSTNVVSPLTTLEEKYFRNNKAGLVNLLKENQLNIDESMLHKDPMTSNDVELMVATLSADNYLKLDAIDTIDKNASTFSNVVEVVKDLVDFDIQKANLEDTVSIMNYVVQKSKNDGNLDELLKIKESFSYQSQLKGILKNRTDKSKPGYLEYSKGDFRSKIAKKDSKILDEVLFSFEERTIVNKENKLSVDLDSIPSGNALTWEIVTQPTGSNLVLANSEDTKSVTFTPSVVGEYQVKIELANDTTTSIKFVNFTVKEDIPFEEVKIQGFDVDIDKKELLGAILNQSWVASKFLNETEIKEIVSKYPTLTVKTYNKNFGVLVEYDETNSASLESLESLKYEFGISDVFNRVYEGENAFKSAAIYPDDNGAFNDGGANWHLEAINMPEAWEYSKGDKSFLIGVCDGGYDTNHQDLAGRFAAILNYGASGASGDHGMAVTGAIGANTNNKIGISGINWESQFVTSYMGTGYVQDVAETKQNGKGVKLVSNSWGVHLASNFDPTNAYLVSQRESQLSSYWKQIRQLLSAKNDQLFLWAAGNGVGNGRSSTGYYGVDARYDNGGIQYNNGVLDKIDNLLVVAAFKMAGDKKVLTYYSNYGESVDIASPTEFDSLKLNNGIYSRFGGTSAATPVVSGVASLIMTINPNLTAQQVKKILIDSATETITQRYYSPYSSSFKTLANPIPVLNAREALKMAYETINPPDDGGDDNGDGGDENPTPNPSSLDFMAEITDNFTPKATFTYYTFEKGFVIKSISSKLQSSSDGSSYSDFGTTQIDNSAIIVTLDPNKRFHKIISTITLEHMLTKETKTQTHTQEFSYADMTINSKKAADMSMLAEADFTIMSGSIFKKFKIEGTTDSNGIKKVYLPYNMYNVLGEKTGYKNAMAQKMLMESQAYSLDLLFGLDGTTQQGSISGLVTDITNNPIEGATVGIYNGTTLIKETTTNASGYYQLTNIEKNDVSGNPITNFVIKVVKSTYRDTKRENIIVLDGKDRSENFVLLKIPTNQSPVAVAGPDKVINENQEVQLSGSSSYDADGTITSYEWREGSTVVSSSENFTKSDLSVGTHEFVLIVTDDDGAKGADYVSVTVNKLLTYNWISGTWGDCTGECGADNGTRTRTVTCQDSDGNTVSDSLCKQTKPVTTQSCTASICETEYYWKVGSWSNCKGNCGISDGIQTREVSCQDQNHYAVEDSLCSATKPITSQSCSTAPCNFEFETIKSGVTQRIWIDRNLGAKQQCTSINDTECFGDYYQWGREEDGHQVSTSETTGTKATEVKPNHSKFIQTTVLDTDWTTADSNGTARNEFWMRSDGYGFCPNGFRLPTIEELKAENIENAQDAFDRFKIASAGFRKYSDGTLDIRGAYLWSSTTVNGRAHHMQYTPSDGAVEVVSMRSFGIPVRCINQQANDNIPPVAKVEAEPSTAIEGETINFKGSLSSDSDGYIVSYKWEEGATILSNSADFSTTDLEVGIHNISLTVTDNLGATHTESLTVTINQKPEYYWNISDWGSCSGECGIDNGTQSREVVCKDQNNLVVEDTLCTAEKPATSQSCTASYCAPEYEEITSPTTGRIWLDRNLGANNVCSSVDDENCFGYYFQWGRKQDGHERISSETIDNISSTLTPTHGYFIKSSMDFDFDWTVIDGDGTLRSASWAQADGKGVCPGGFRVPTKDEVIAERITNPNEAFDKLKLSTSGYRNKDGVLTEKATAGYIWTTDYQSNRGTALRFDDSFPGMVKLNGTFLSKGINIRCIKVKDSEINTNKVPVANAGADQVITFEQSATLDGSKSYDPDGTITKYEWKEGSLILSTSSSFTKADFSVGSHELTLIVTDNDGATATDTVIINVNEKLTYNWVSEDWSACEGACGTNNGTQTRTVTCQDADGNTVADNLCTATKPPLSQECTASLCEDFDTITSPVTGKIWMDRNLGASRACISLTDTQCYGDYFQWGRANDGHQKKETSTTITISPTVAVSDDKFILSTISDAYDWTSGDTTGATRTSSWQKTDGSSICPTGFRVPTSTELEAENIDSISKAFNNLKFPIAGYRDHEDGVIRGDGKFGGVWSSSTNGDNSMYLYFSNDTQDWNYQSRARGRSVRCIKE